MTTTKKLDQVVQKALEEFDASRAKLSLPEQLEKLTRVIEEIAATQQLADREKAISASPDGMYVRNNAGTYITQSEAEQALKTIERLEQEARAMKDAA